MKAQCHPIIHVRYTEINQTITREEKKIKNKISRRVNSRTSFVSSVESTIIYSSVSLNYKKQMKI